MQWRLEHNLYSFGYSTTYYITTWRFIVSIHPTPKIFDHNSMVLCKYFYTIHYIHSPYSVSIWKNNIIYSSDAQCNMLSIYIIVLCVFCLYLFLYNGYATMKCWIRCFLFWMRWKQWSPKTINPGSSSNFFNILPFIWIVVTYALTGLHLLSKILRRRI